ETYRSVEAHLAVGIHLKYSGIEWISRKRCGLFRKEIIEGAACRKISDGFKIGVATCFFLGWAIIHQVAIDHFLGHTETVPPAQTFWHGSPAHGLNHVRCISTPNQLRVNGCHRFPVEDLRIGSERINTTSSTRVGIVEVRV